MSAAILEEELAKHCLALGTGSSASLFSNEYLLKDTGNTSRRLKLETNGGEARSNKRRILHDLRA